MTDTPPPPDEHGPAPLSDERMATIRELVETTEWCKEPGECGSFFMNMETGKPYTCQHRREAFFAAGPELLAHSDALAAQVAELRAKLALNEPPEMAVMALESVLKREQHERDRLSEQLAAERQERARLFSVVVMSREFFHLVDEYRAALMLRDSMAPALDELLSKKESDFRSLIGEWPIGHEQHDRDLEPALSAAQPSGDAGEASDA